MIEDLIKSRRLDEDARQLEKIGTVKYVYEYVPYLAIQYEEKDARSMRRALSGQKSAYSSFVQNVSSITRSHTLSIPPYTQGVAQGLWNLEMVGGYEAQQYATGTGRIIANIDTGVDYTHPEISHAFGSYKGHDFIRNTNDPMDRNGHGTFVAGIQVGDTYGLAYDSRLLAYRVLDESGSGSDVDVMAATERAMKDGAHVIGYSLGGSFATPAFAELCTIATRMGHYLIASAGNTGKRGYNYPAAYPGVIAVPSVDINGEWSRFSTISSANDVAAGGENITSIWPGRGTNTLSGTSFSAPLVESIIALMLEVSSHDLEELMKQTADEKVPQEKYGAGIARADKMMETIYQPSVKRYVMNMIDEVRQIVGV